MRDTHTINMIAETDDYFLADLDDGGVRIGMKGFAAINFPLSHAEYHHIKALKADQIEEAFDAYYIARTPPQTNGYRNA